MVSAISERHLDLRTESHGPFAGYRRLRFSFFQVA
jgi:hypothetical protein